MDLLWSALFMIGGILGGQLATWIYGLWVTRHRPATSVEDATERILAALAEQRRLTEAALRRIASGAGE